ncbi:MAG: CRISPR-associated helicase Cas3' [Synergistaceae bacterium]|jgi:CRISPR-associated endonuclease/helicase Cas3|nr:CRISPR-associated helicase Cas3' [Synergistaceae bacterium]
MLKFIAHIREEDRREQTLDEHLRGVALRCGKNAEKFGLAEFGELLGLLHDMGKYSDAFQSYIRLPSGRSDQDADDSASSLPGDAKAALKGKIDHSTAGARLAWLSADHEKNELAETLTAQILSLSIASHHSGLIDCVSPLGADVYAKRMDKSDELTHLPEVLTKVSPEILERVNDLLKIVLTPNYLRDTVKSMLKLETGGSRGKSRFDFKTGILLRMLFSCLVDADRTDTIDFERHGAAALRQEGRYVEWPLLLARLEDHLRGFGGAGAVNVGRALISGCCKAAAERDKGIFTLTVPTGGGKTLASLRFALRHAEKHGFDRIFYVIPYTSIIDQNARVVREILESGDDERGRIVLECHSNLSSERNTWRGKLLSENWDAPIVFTTNVQFLEAMFAGGTRSARRTHQLARSIIIFDEIQTMPIRLVHMFCNAVNFLVERCGSSVVLCTATQPLLNGVDRELGALNYSDKNEIIPDVRGTFDKFARTKIIDMRRQGGYSSDDIGELALRERETAGTTLVVVNTTKTARSVYKYIKKHFPDTVHLSARMCPAHRAEVLERIRESLGTNPQTPLICVATQVIEAGVDVDFGSVIRCLAGLDSITQAAGRANRHGLRDVARVVLVDPNDENISSLDDIQEGANATLKVLDDIIKSGAYSSDGLTITPEIMDSYFDQYFYKRANLMAYPASEPRCDTLLNMLSSNSNAMHDYGLNKKREQDRSAVIPLRQSFASAAGMFRAMEMPGGSVIVPYERGEDIIAELCGEFKFSENFKLLRDAQKYSVNVYPGHLKSLCESGAVYEISTSSCGESLGFWALRKEFYHSDFGLSDECTQDMELLLK